MKQYRVNRFIFVLFVVVITTIALLLGGIYGEMTPIDLILIGAFGLVGIIGVYLGLIQGLASAFVVTLFYGIAVLFTGMSDIVDPMDISYLYLVLPTAVAVFTGVISLFNVRSMRASKAMEDDYQALVRIDDLTGFRNEMDYMIHLEEEINRAKRYGHDLSVILLHIESFTALNELYGKIQGERFLKYLSEFIVEITRNVDKHYRIKENVFAVILPHTDKEGAEILKARFIKELETMSIIIKTNNQAIDINIDMVLEQYNQEDLRANTFHHRLMDELKRLRGENA